MTASTTTVWPSDLLRATDLTRLALDALLRLAGRMKAQPAAYAGALSGEALTCLYDVPTTRAGHSLQVAAHRLGMEPIGVRPDGLDDDDGEGETLEDAAQILSGWSAAIVARDLGDRTLSRLADAASVPVVNARSPEHHPCQALTDVFTMREHFGELDGLVIAYVGPSSNAARSLLTIGALAGMTVRVAAPSEYRPEPEDLTAAAVMGELHGGQAALVDDPQQAVSGADAIVTGPWPRPADPVERRRLHEQLAPYRVTPATVDLAAARAIVLHHLPVHRGEEVRAAVVDHPQTVVWRQAANRVPVEQAVVYALSGGDEG